MKRQSALPCAAFTLLEILLALAVIALLTTIFIGSAASLLRDRPATADEVFWKACQSARQSALKEGHDVRLSFDDKAKAFIVDDGSAPKPFPAPGPTRDLTVSFLTTQAGASSILLGGTLVETGTQAGATFFSDGTCSPFRVQFVLAGSAHVLAIDPWTCAQVLPPKENL